MPGPDLEAITAAFHAANPDSTSTPSTTAIRNAMYLAQLADAVNSTRGFKSGEHETNPTMRPFSHGGIPMMLLGFGIGDALRDHLLRHASKGTRNTADAMQTVLNLAGIAQTNADLPRSATAKVIDLGTPPTAPTPALDPMRRRGQ